MPEEGTAALSCVGHVDAADAVRLGSQTNVVRARQGMRRMLKRLPKRGAAVALPVQARPHVQMSIEIDYPHRSAGSDIAQVVTIGCLVAAAEDDGDRAGLQDATNY